MVLVKLEDIENPNPDYVHLARAVAVEEESRLMLLKEMSPKALEAYFREAVSLCVFAMCNHLHRLQSDADRLGHKTDRMKRIADALAELEK